MMDRAEALQGCGVHPHFESGYEGEAPDRHRVEYPNEVRSVFLAITPVEWAFMAQREGSAYVGGCCANMSHAQDIINGAFRDSGTIDSDDLATVAEYCKDHDFEEFDDQFWDERRFGNMVKLWESQHWQDYTAGQLEPVMNPWAKIGCVYVTFGSRLKPLRFTQPSPSTLGRDDWETALRAMNHLSWSDLFDDSDDAARKATHDANRQLMLARLVPSLYAALQSALSQQQDFDGFALVDPETREPLTNSRGMCIYKTEAAAREVANVWLERQDETHFELRPCRVTVERGLEVL